MNDHSSYKAVLFQPEGANGADIERIRKNLYLQGFPINFPIEVRPGRASFFHLAEQPHGHHAVERDALPTAVFTEIGLLQDDLTKRAQDLRATILDLQAELAYTEYLAEAACRVTEYIDGQPVQTWDRGIAGVGQENDREASWEPSGSNDNADPNGGWTLYFTSPRHFAGPEFPQDAEHCLGAGWTLDEAITVGRAFVLNGVVPEATPAYDQPHQPLRRAG